MSDLKRVQTDLLEIAYLEYVPGEGVAEKPIPAVLLHGFPYDVQSYAEVAPQLAAHGIRTIVPYLRGYGPTKFLNANTLRSGQQAVLAHDLLDLLDALSIEQAIVGGYDWGGRAACIVSALWPDRVVGLATCNGYNVQNIPAMAQPAAPVAEHRYWYQYYLHGERGRLGLQRNRYEFCKLLWSLWSPNWRFDEATYQRSAGSFDNPDFVEVVVHSYRHRYDLVAGDPAVADTERRLLEQPKINVPTWVFDGGGDGVHPPRPAELHRVQFGGPLTYREIPLVGHNVPQEAPDAFIEAILALI